MNGCKIGKVTFKDSKLSVIHNDFEDVGLIVEHARTIQDSFAGELTSHLILGWNSEGEYSIGFNLESSVIPSGLMPSWVHDILLRGITEKSTIGILEDMGIIQD